MKEFAAVIFAVLALAALDAQAVPVTWTLSGVTFLDGGTASGSFAYDAATNTYSSINITLIGGTQPALDQTYNIACLNPPCNAALSPTSSFVIFGVAPLPGDMTGQPNVNFVFNTPLSNGGGNVVVNTAGGGKEACGSADCFTAPVGRNDFAAGSVIGTVPSVPTPTLSNWALLILALLVTSVIIFDRKRLGGR